MCKQHAKERNSKSTLKQHGLVLTPECSTYRRYACKFLRLLPFNLLSFLNDGTILCDRMFWRHRGGAESLKHR